MTNNTKFTSIKTNRLILRRLLPEDTQAVYSYRSDPIVAKFQNWKPKSLSETKTFLEQLAKVNPDTAGTWLQLAIENRADKTLIGDCGIGFQADDNYQAELGMTLMPASQGEGFAAEALQAIIGYLFDTLGKHRLFASLDPRNKAAIALMKRVMMRQEAHFRQSLLIDGEWVDDLIFAMLASEWKLIREA